MKEFERDVIIDLRGRPGDVRYECPVDGCWYVTLTTDGEEEWTKGRTIRPRCTKHDVELVRKVFA